MALPWRQWAQEKPSLGLKMRISGDIHSACHLHPGQDQESTGKSGSLSLKGKERDRVYSVVTKAEDKENPSAKSS